MAEAFVPSFGILGLGGIAALLFGSLMLIDTDVPGVGISLKVILSTVITALLSVLFFIRVAWRAQRGRPVTGSEGLVGEVGVALNDLSLSGTIRVHGEIWSAESDEPIPAGEEAEVVEVVGLKVRVKRIKR